MSITPLQATDLADPTSLNSRLTALEATIAGGGVSALSGTILFYAGSAIPAGWLACDGSAVLRGLYPNLFTAVGTSFGVGDGSSTFNLPDLRGRTPIGIGTGPTLSTRTLNQAVGEENHQLTVPELPSHTHSAGSYTTVAGLGTPVANTVPNVSANSGSNGSDTPHNNMQPSLVLKAMIKT